jgi:TatA/E family protein of Tat protein translocase
MFGLSHLPEILFICFVGLLIFGPKRMISMGSALGKAVRELRESTKDLNWSALLGGSKSTNRAPTTLGALSQFTQTLSSGLNNLNASSSSTTATTVTPAPEEAVVESASTSEDQGNLKAVDGVKDAAVD